MEAATPGSTREVAQFTIKNPDGSTTLTAEGRRELEQGLPARIFGVERLERAAANSTKLDKAIDTAFPKAMFLILPVFALLTNIAWRRTVPRYPAHLYAALHLHAAWFAALAVGTVATAFVPNKVADIIGIALLAYGVWYGLAALKLVFGESWPRTLAKSAVIAVAYGASLFVVSILMLGYAIFTI